jgi:uncharacterized protein
MKLSKFNLWVEDYPVKGEYLLFNARTQALIKVNREFKDALYLSEELGECPAQIKNNLKALKNNGIIVEDTQEEASKLNDFFRQLKYECGGLAFEATILTTYNCNFKCVYCFEESVKENVSLDRQTSSLITEWLIKTAEKRNLKRIFIVYYGGEPLLNIQPMYDISRAMREWSKKKNIDFGFGMITNGSLLNPEVMDRFVSLGCKNIRITIDGDRQVHDQKRPFLDGSPSFDAIIENIKSIIDKVSIDISGNFDRESFQGMFRLLDYLEDEGLLQKLHSIGFAPLVPRLGPKTNPGAVELSECASFIGKDGLFNETISIKKELIRRGVNVPTGLAINACPLFMRDAGVTIDPKGMIYKCNSLLGYPEFSVGDVRKEALNEKADEFFNIDAWKKCPADCPYVPMCQGGCRFFSYVENKNFTDLACKREYFDRIIPELIKLEYETLHSRRRDNVIKRV